MDIKKIKAIAENDSLINKELAILSVIAEDKKAIEYVLALLQLERLHKAELISDSNQELSRALVVLEDSKTKKSQWIVNQIKHHYVKWKNDITCNFNVDGIP